MKENNSANLPLITLIVLLATVVALLFVGYEHFLGPETSSLTKAQTIELKEELPVENIASTMVISDSTDSDTATVSPDQESIDLAQQKKEAEAEKVPEETVEEPAGKSYSYQAESGETAESIAKNFGITVEQLKAMNPSGIKAGLKYRLFTL